MFVGAGDGKVEWRLSDGTLNMILDTGAAGSETTGMAFDEDGNLYVTAFQDNNVYKFNRDGTYLGTWGYGYNAHPESIVFDADGYSYIGQADGSRDVLKFNLLGDVSADLDPATGPRGTDWIDLKSDQCSLLYTSEGRVIRQFDVCTNAQLADWTTLSGSGTTYALRLIGDDSVLVADWDDIVWIRADGSVIRTFDAPGENAWFAMNLDPDGASFWSADYYTGEVFRFDLTSGQVMSTFQSTGQAHGLAVFGEFHAGTVRDCSAEDLSGQSGEIDPDPDPANGERVTVVYDWHMLAPLVGEADGMAQAVKDRAERTLDEYGSQGVDNQPGLGLPTPAALRIEIRCRTEPIDAIGLTSEPGKVQLRAENIRNWLAQEARDGFPAGGGWDAAGAPWKSLVDHELFHAVQWESGFNPVIEEANFNQTEIESPAVLAQDLLADVDDLDLASTDQSYLSWVKLFADQRPSIDAPGSLLGLVFGDGRAPYEAASILQYWAERHGPQNPDVDLEHRAIAFLQALMAAPYSHQTTDFAATLGYNYQTHDYRYADLVGALRDYYLTHYALNRAINVSATQNAAYALLDAKTGHGLTPGDPAPSQASYPSFDVTGRQLQTTDSPWSLPVKQWSGDVYELRFPAGTTHLELHLDSSFSTGRFAIGLVPVNEANEFVIDPTLLRGGPRSFVPMDVTLPVVGVDHVALVLVHGIDPPGDELSSSGDGTTTLDLTAVAKSGQPGIDFLPPSTHELRNPLAGPIEVNLVPTLGGQALGAGLPRNAFRLTVNGLNATIRSADYRDGAYHLVAWAPASLQAGTYPMTLAFAEQQFSVPGGMVIDQAAPPIWARISAGTTAALGQGQTSTASAPITAGAGAATFHTVWSGSSFDLTLTSPSGRVIASDSTDPDVTVTRTATSLDISIAAPEVGTWQFTIAGTDVPNPEPVDFEVTEADAPLTGSLSVASQGLAGLPIEVHFAFNAAADGLADATAMATVTDPAGVSRRFTLCDDGASADADANDGVFGGQLWATDLAGTYRVDVVASATTEGGAPVQRAASATVTLGTKVDSDGDGVADAAEPLFGLDPQDPADGETDQDGDGLTVAQELSAGSDPASWDTDRGGENDASELDAGREVAFAGDDAATETVAMGAAAEDGNIVSVTVSTASGNGSVHLYRLSGSIKTDLGLYPGSGATFEDGPLADGEYTYVALPVAAGGAVGVPFVVGPVSVAADVTPPIVRITLNQGSWEADNPNVSVTFTDLSEPIADMRLARSEDDLASAPWIPFSPYASITVPSDLGQHFVYAQVRDTAGNESRVASSFVFLIDDIPPISQAGPLDAQYSTPTIGVPYTASDDLSGVASVALWWRYSTDGGATWTGWTEGSSGSSSPISFTFPSGPGDYEFYTIAADASGNVEPAPSSADAGTSYVTASTLVMSGQTTITGGSCGIIQGGSVSPDSLNQCISLGVSGEAQASAAIETVDLRVYGYKASGSTLLADWAVAQPWDGAYDSPDESFYALYSFDDGGWDSFIVDARVFAGGVETDATITVPIDRTPPPDTTPPTSSINSLPASTRDSLISLSGYASDNSPGGTLSISIRYRFRVSTRDAWGGWTTSATLSEEPNPAQFSSPFTFPDGKGYYEFYSIATDMAGNEESPPPAADATIQKK